jgi:hypothetical protein
MKIGYLPPGVVSETRDITLFAPGEVFPERFVPQWVSRRSFPGAFCTAMGIQKKFSCHFLK